MRDPLSRDFSSFQPSQDSWFHRVRDNFQQLLMPARIFPSSANGAPLHLLTFRRTATAGGARTLSLLTHAALLFGILLLNLPSHAPGVAGAGPELASHSGLTFFPSPKIATLAAHHSVKRVGAVKMIQDQRDTDSSRRVLPFHWLRRVGS